MIGLIDSWDVEYNGTENEALFKLVCDSAGELSSLTHYDNIKIRIGSECTDIATGDKYLKSSTGWILQPSENQFQNVYTKAEIDSMFYMYYTKTEADSLFEWTTITIITDTLPLTFIADGSPLTIWSIKGNGEQDGTPAPDNPIMPEFVGTLDNSDWTIPITCAGQTTPVYLGQVSTVRKIRKLVLTGTENWLVESGVNGLFTLPNIISKVQYADQLCSHFSLASDYINFYNNDLTFAVISRPALVIHFNAKQTVQAFKQWLADEYAAGHPVTIWYVIAEPTTGIVNEPLCKIGDYADELHSEDAGVTIPTARGQNTLTVDTTIQPSEMSITGKIREV